MDLPCLIHKDLSVFLFFPSLLLANLGIQKSVFVGATGGGGPFLAKQALPAWRMGLAEASARPPREARGKWTGGGGTLSFLR